MKLTSPHVQVTTSFSFSWLAACLLGVVASSTLAHAQLIGANITVNGAGTGFEPKVAYLAGTNRYLVTWLRGVGGGVTILVGQLLNSSGSPVGGVITIESNTSAFAAIGAWATTAVRQSDRFLVAYNLSGVTWGRAIDANTGVVSPANSLTSTYLGTDPIYLGGDSQLCTNPPFDTACLAWSTAGAFGGAATYYMRVQVPPAGSGSGPSPQGPQLLNSGSFLLGYPSVSHDCGPGGRWLITYATGNGVEGAVVSRTGALLTNHVSLAPALTGANNHACAGDGTRFTVVYTALESNLSNTDVYARVGTYTGGSLSLQPAAPVANVSGSDEFRPVVCLAKYKTLVSWTEAAGTNFQLALESLDPATGAVCDNKAVYYTTSVSPPLVYLASEQEGGDATSDRALGVWATDLFNILAQRMESAQVCPIPGSGCPGAPPCNVVGVPRLGTTICFDRQPPCQPPSLPFIIFGTEFVPPVAIFPPLACAPAGATCSLACNPVATFGQPRLCLNIPLRTALVGQCFCIQCGCVNPTAVGFCIQLCQARKVCILP